MTDPMILSGTANNIDSLRQNLIAGSQKVQQQIIPQLANLGNEGLEVLQEFLLKRRDTPATWIDGNAYQVVYNSDAPTAKEFLETNFPEGIVPLKSDCGISYNSLQQLLTRQEFQAADLLTIQKMCEVAGPTTVQRKWLYFTDVDNFPIQDLRTINHLWLVHSEGKFGFSVQREIWLGLGKNWINLWTKIGWKSGNNWTRYPHEFTWDLSAPRGHLPLSNQLRGVRVMSSLLNHPAWNT
ncbi:GUN4 domain-containing protein [Anabaena cylindrica FACHB-243]|uniref:GUN4 domain protein n=1 Tax=Anabaena cylindrica (strain ATCC 27899 / PCC 7122) TaxID=272123 RepID=K9ZCV8_ANACC|nr:MULTISPECIES: GUN4 domain-containing protein [Anabaena]AFZ56559.1 GUN4 domain protein [Anabaena cylindrica PCC 7122]MBD2420823.1 GUN4 domain-containing protein [Anabaena cylindrica FACHB-243]MBY5285547.1 GUN4 domain-containing protein [Anabaena sp. CCAP 1446/1C]MBY5310418.1 GUN4 domain-containing protein [Anabaena sp. CCAP 1446/1C]MCM2409810.1 GUN4 domain-containing protein [Anabaena sp. CCAP 1446/1C]